MLIKRSQANSVKIENCHEGSGIVHCTDYIGDYEKKTPGFKFVHDDIIEPGTTIGEHTHTDDEEIYFIAEGNGTMVIDGEKKPVKAGDFIITRKGHSHGLINDSKEQMRIFVACTALGEEND